MPLIQVVIVLIMVGVLLWLGVKKYRRWQRLPSENIVDVGPVLATKEER